MAPPGGGRSLRGVYEGISVRATVMWCDEVAAVRTLSEGVTREPWVEAMPMTHPDRLVIEVKIGIARGYLTGQVEGRYDDLQCESVAHEIIAERYRTGREDDLFHDPARELIDRL